MAEPAESAGVMAGNGRNGSSWWNPQLLIQLFLACLSGVVGSLLFLFNTRDGIQRDFDVRLAAAKAEIRSEMQGSTRGLITEREFFTLRNEIDRQQAEISKALARIEYQVKR